MDDLTCCLSKVVRFCLETSILLNQFYQFECQLANFRAISHRIPLQTYSTTYNRFSIIIDDLNVYHRDDFSKIYSKVVDYLSKTHFTVNSSRAVSDDFDEDLSRLNRFFSEYQRYYKDIFYYLHKLTITCSLSIQYRQLCTDLEFANRFVHIRIDLLTDLEQVNDRIHHRITEMNSHFRQRNELDNDPHFQIPHLIRTLSLWLLMIFFGICYFQWPILSERQPNKGWPM